jgi:hypothetical protein
MARSIADAIRESWASGRVEVIAGVADGMRLSHGYNYDQVHRTFCQVLGFEISLGEFDLIMFAADEGYTGSVVGVPVRTPPEEPYGRSRL